MVTSREIIKHSKVTMACLASLLLMIVLYLYFLNMSVVQVVMRTENLQKLNNLNSEIASLDADYIKAQYKISNRIALLEGYNTNTKKIFVSRNQADFALAP